MQKRLQPETHHGQVDSIPGPESPLEKDLRRSIELVKTNKAEPDRPPSDTIPPFAPTTEKEVGSPTVRQNGKNQSVPITRLEHALKTAISAAHNAEKFGAELGYVVRFDADAIKSIAITVLINMSGENRR